MASVGLYGKEEDRPSWIIAFKMFEKYSAIYYLIRVEGINN